MKFQLGEGIIFESTAPHHAQGLFDVVDKNREYLSTFLPWVSQMQSVDNFKAYIRNCEILSNAGTEASFVILRDEAVIGRIGIHHIHRQNQNGEIGYWLAQTATGKGIITKSCRSLITYGFEKLGLHRIVIKAAVGNSRSRNIPGRLGFSYEGILRQAEKVNGVFVDLAVYSLLKHEWKNL